MPEIRRWCDDLVYLQAPEDFWAIGQFYEDFSQITDDEVVILLQKANSNYQERVLEQGRPTSYPKIGKPNRANSEKQASFRRAHRQ
jgi:hypothetical protein